MGNGERHYAIRCDGDRIDLRDLPTERDGVSEEEALARIDANGKELDELQELLYAAGTDALLVVLQGMDTSGKDGTIRRVFTTMDPQGIRVASFKVPTALELAHDFLWRVHKETPELGMVVIFNRSHYEAVAVERVKAIVPEAVWRGRYAHIRNFEQLLCDSRTLVVKFFLHISPEEQEERLLERQEKVEKAWKLSAGDWLERRNWDAYMDAYSEAISETGTDAAPWWVVPADDKWYRDLAVSQVLVETLRPHRERWLETLRERGERELAAIRELRAGQRADGPPEDAAAAGDDDGKGKKGGKNGKAGKNGNKKDRDR